MERLGSSTFLLRRPSEGLLTNKDQRTRRLNEGRDIETYRFTRALFGLTCSPFLLGGVIEQHLQAWESKKPETVTTLRNSLYVDDLLNGSQTRLLIKAKS